MEKSPGLISEFSRRRVASAGLTQLVTYLLCFLTFIATFFASALISDSPTTMILLSFLAAALVLWFGSHFSGKLFKVKRQKLYIGMQLGSVITILSGLVVYLILQPLVPKVDQYVAEEVAGVDFWELPTGSKIAFRKFPSKTKAQKLPVIILHGGPGAYSVTFKPMLDVFSNLTANGHDVYFYDQVGSGLSERLSDVSEYSLDRHIADLNAIRQKIRTDQVILIGSSWGATLAANYLAEYPDSVGSAIFSSPGPIYRPDWLEISDGTLDEKMNSRQKEQLDAAIEKPRLFVAIALAEINPAAAARFAPDQEMGSFFDKIANEHYLPLAMCDPKKLDARSSGYGFWSSRMTGKTLVNQRFDPKPALTKIDIPVLVLRGPCDYKNEAVARQYTAIFPNSRFEEVKDTGHMAYGEDPQQYLRLLTDFLR